MKKTIATFIILATAALPSLAQNDVQAAAAAAAAAISEAPQTQEAVVKPSYWTSSARVDFGVNQTYFGSWAAGGYNNVTLKSGFDGQANYKKDLMSWANRLQLDYGFLWSADKKELMQKNTDRLYLQSTWGYSPKKDSKWKATAAFDFRTQFSKGYTAYKQDATTGKWSGTVKSDLLSPAYTNIALGLDWTPKPWFNINLAPLTGSLVICTNEDLRANYGMKVKDSSITDPVGSDYHPALFQLGAQVKTNMKFSLNSVINYETQLVVFTDYLSEPYFRVNWDNIVNWQISKLIALQFKTWLIYDPIVLIDGEKKVQFKEFLSFNLTYTFSKKK